MHLYGNLFFAACSLASIAIVTIYSAYDHIKFGPHPRHTDDVIDISVSAARC